MLELFPRLASFDLPDNRNPEHLWEDDARMLKEWAEGKRDDCLVHVAKNAFIIDLGFKRFMP
jgi:hypothetical protein